MGECPNGLYIRFFKKEKEIALKQLNIQNLNSQSLSWQSFPFPPHPPKKTSLSFQVTLGSRSYPVVRGQHFAHAQRDLHVYCLMQSKGGPQVPATLSPHGLEVKFSKEALRGLMQLAAQKVAVNLVYGRHKTAVSPAGYHSWMIWGTRSPEFRMGHFPRG